jgi:hypothetical protein
MQIASPAVRQPTIRNFAKLIVGEPQLACRCLLEDLTSEQLGNR